MSYRNRLAAAVLTVLFAAAPLAAQFHRSVVIGMYGGGYDHIVNLNDAGTSHGTADFTSGHTFGATAGVQLNRYFALHGDFTFARNQAEGDESFAGREFNRFFYGVHVEAGYPLPGGVTPYLFAGGGAVTIDELGSPATINTFTKPAGMFGAGFFFALSKRLEAFAEGKQLVYRWDRGGFAAMPLSFTTTEGQTYRVDLGTGDFNRTQWDLTYTFGLSYRFNIGARHSATMGAPSDE